MGRRIPRGARVSGVWPRLTGHARRRVAQRGVPRAAVCAAIDWGREVQQRGGRTLFHLGERAVTRAACFGVDLRTYTNVCVVLAPDGAAVTVFRSTDTRRMRRGIR